MAEDVDQEQKTEEPSGKRLDEARERGQLPISREMATFVCLLSSLIVVAKIAPGMSEQLVGSLRMFFEHVHEIELGGPQHADGDDASDVKRRIGDRPHFFRFGGCRYLGNDVADRLFHEHRYDQDRSRAS